MAMPPAVIGLDVGTSQVKAVAFALDASAPVVRRTSVTVHRTGARHEIDPGALVQCVRRALASCIGALGGREVRAIGVTTAMHGLCALDAAGNPLTPIVTWADGRATAEATELRADRWQARTGTPVHPMSPFVKLVWFARHMPDLCARTHTWVGVKELVLADLTGALVVDESSASGTGLAELGRPAWLPDALTAAGITAEQLAPQVPVTERLHLRPSLAAALGLPPATTVVAGLADGPAANLGTGATGPGIAALSLGTSAALRIVVPSADAPTPERFVYALDGERWVTGGAVSNAGALLSWVRGLLGAGTATDAELLEAAAAVPPGADGLILVPYVLPERAPQWDPSRTGALIGLRSDHTQAHLVRAVVEAVAAQLGEVSRTIEPVSQVREVHATGGALTSELWRGVLAAELGCPLVMHDLECGALGAAAVALVGHSGNGSVDDAVQTLTPASAVQLRVEPDAALVSVAAEARSLRRRAEEATSGFVRRTV